MSRAPGSALSHRRWGTAPSSLFPAPRPHQLPSTAQLPASRYIPGRYKDVNRPYPHLPPTLRSANRTQYSPLAKRGAKRGGETGRVRASETRQNPGYGQVSGSGQLSNTTAVPSAYRRSIPHGGCSTVLWSQLLERDTPMFASRPRADHLAWRAGSTAERGRYLPAMTAIPEEEVADWIQAIAALYAYAARDSEDANAAADAAANLWSGFGYQDAPARVLEMFVQAIEVGYASALRDVREGNFDDEIRMWRPELAES
jgi:hypothetical protein